MQTELSLAALTNAAENVLETMFFTMSEPIVEPAEWEGPTMSAEVEFTGHLHGRFQLEMDQRCALELAGNASGEPDTDNVDIEQSVFLICELANMLCGNTLSRLKPAELFDLRAPRLLESASARAWRAAQQESETVRWLQTDAGLMCLCFQLEDKA